MAYDSEQKAFAVVRGSYGRLYDLDAAASAAASALKKLKTNCGLVVVNLGTGKGYSVLDVLHAYEKACGKTLPYVVDPRRPGDIATCYADPAKSASVLGWTATHTLEDMCRDSWNWQSKNPMGYSE